MKKVLIITYYWPPTSGSGVQRWLKFAKYLPQFGYQPIIYTPENPAYPLRDESLLKDISPDTIILKQPIKEAYGLIRPPSKNSKGDLPNVNNDTVVAKFKSWIRGNLFIPDPKISWVKPSIQFLKNYLTNNPVDTVITTGPPHSMHLIGLGLKQNLNIKWVADFRDPWSQFGDLLDKLHVSKTNRKKYAEQEQSVLENCDIVLSTSRHMHQRLQPFDHSKHRVITNGYDHEDFASFQDRSPEGGLKIYHAGLLNHERHPISFWNALDNLSLQYPDLCLHLVGSDTGEVTPYIQGLSNLASRFLYEAHKTHSEVVKEYETSNILLLLVNNSENSNACIPGKTFEYLATGKPIICFAPKGSEVFSALQDPRHLLLNYSDSTAHIEDRLKGYFNYLSNDMQPSMKDKSYSRRSLTSNLVDLLEEIQ